MNRQILFLVCALSAALAADPPAALFEEAERLARSHRNLEAMAKVEEAVAEVERAHAAGEKISWQGMNGFRFASRLAREDFLDFEKSFHFCNRLFELADSDYWRVPARLEKALTYRAMKDFESAQREYDAIAAGDERQASSRLLPQAEMIYFDLEDEGRGGALLREALLKPELNGYERFGSLRRCAQAALGRGRLEQAATWYGLVEQMPFDKPAERARFLSQAWFELAQIEESRGRLAEAKALYRKTMEGEAGEMSYRARARDALESIEYFE